MSDIEQDIILLLLERFTQDPDFLDDPVSAVGWAANRAGWQARKERSHAAEYLAEDAPVGDGPNAPTLLEYYASDNPWPTVERRLIIESGLSTLSAHDRQIAAGLAQGYSAREAAGMVGCSFSTVYNRKPAIAAALAAV